MEKNDIPANSENATAANGASNALSAEAANSFLTPEEKTRYGLNVRVAGDKVEAFFHAGGQDNVVASAPLTQGSADKGPALQKLIDSREKELQDRYHISFAVQGEDLQSQVSADKDCKRQLGEMVHARQPTFKDLYAVNEAMAHSEPSQLGADGQTGVKLYFADKQIFPAPVYGDKQALAVYMPKDKNDHIAMYVMPNAQDLPATTKDAKGIKDRNLAFVIEHELTHNSQHNLFQSYPYLPVGYPEQFGWETKNRLEKDDKVVFQSEELKGTSGVKYFNATVNCNEPTEWLGIKDDALVGTNGAPVIKPNEARNFSSDEVAADAQVKPVSYYFSKPLEMLSEGIATFRNSRENRAREFATSPQLYDVVKKYDQDELGHFYGTNTYGETLVMRNPDGLVVPRTAEAEAELDKFEKGLQKLR